MRKADQDIIEKVQKLLALANSDNEHEAALAANRAQALLTKYNLTMQDVAFEEGEEKYIREDFATGRGRASQEWKYIQSLLQEFYFIRIVQSKRVVPGGQFWKPKTEIVYCFLGQAHNVEIAKFVRDFLTRSFKDLFAAYRKANKAPASGRESFYLGLYKGLHGQLKSTLKQVEQETGLVVVEDAGLDEFINDAFNKLKSKAVSVRNANDADALAAGAEEGKNLRIARGLGGEASKRDIGQTLRIGPGSN
jgi:hypothetical protein